jgi:hypothetical protein
MKPPKVLNRGWLDRSGSEDHQWFPRTSAKSEHRKSANKQRRSALWPSSSKRLFSVRMAGASRKDIATFLRLAEDRLEQDE